MVNGKVKREFCGKEINKQNEKKTTTTKKKCFANTTTNVYEKHEINVKMR